MDTELRRTIRNLVHSGQDPQTVIATIAAELDISYLDLFHMTMNICTGINVSIPRPAAQFLTAEIMSRAYIDRSFHIQYGTEHVRLLKTPEKITLDELLEQNADTLGYQRQLGFIIKWRCLRLNHVEAEVSGDTIPEINKRYIATRIFSAVSTPDPWTQPPLPGPNWGRGSYR